MPRSMMSIPATRLSYFILLMRPNRYGGNRAMRAETSILNGLSAMVVTTQRVGGAVIGRVVGGIALIGGAIGTVVAEPSVGRVVPPGWIWLRRRSHSRRM